MKKSFNFKQHKRFGMAAASVVMVGAMAFGGAVAYLTDNEQTTNTFTVGKVQVDLEEPKYPGNGSAEVTNIVPNQEIDKNPMVENTGKNEAIVYASVSIPVKKLVVADNDGTRQNEAMTQVFQTSADNGASYGNNAVHDGWVLIKTEYKTAGGDLVTKKDGSDEIPDSAVEVVRTYGYNTKLGVGETTDSIFDKVKLVNVIEGYVDSTTQDIEVKTMAIQASNITDKDTSDLTDATKLLNIYNVYVAQNKDTASQDADTNGKKNLHGDEIKTYQTRVYTSIDNSVIEIGKTAQMTTTIDTQDAVATPTYESENTSVATVDADGKVTAVAAGSTTIRATYGGVTASVKITVKAAANVQATNN